MFLFGHLEEIILIEICLMPFVFIISFQVRVVHGLFRLCHISYAFLTELQGVLVKDRIYQENNLISHILTMPRKGFKMGYLSLEKS